MSVVSLADIVAGLADAPQCKLCLHRVYGVPASAKAHWVVRCGAPSCMPPPPKLEQSSLEAMRR